MGHGEDEGDEGDEGVWGERFLPHPPTPDTLPVCPMPHSQCPTQTGWHLPVLMSPTRQAIASSCEL